MLRWITLSLASLAVLAAPVVASAEPIVTPIHHIHHRAHGRRHHHRHHRHPRVGLPR